MRAGFVRLGLAATLSTVLVLTSVSVTDAATRRPAKVWVTYFASATLPAGTWTPGTYWVNNYPNPDQPLYTLHESWTLPTPYSGDQLGPMAGPYYVDPAAPAYRGVALLRMNHIEAITAGTVRKPTCGMVTSFRPGQRTRIVIAMVGDSASPVTRAVWNRQMATVTMTATLDAGGGATVPLRPIKTEVIPANVFDDLCRRAFLR
jgi:hypothetical protein